MGDEIKDVYLTDDELNLLLSTPSAPKPAVPEPSPGPSLETGTKIPSINPPQNIGENLYLTDEEVNLLLKIPPPEENLPKINAPTTPISSGPTAEGERIVSQMLPGVKGEFSLLMPKKELQLKISKALSGGPIVYKELTPKQAEDLKKKFYTAALTGNYKEADKHLNKLISSRFTLDYILSTDVGPVINAFAKGVAKGFLKTGKDALGGILDIADKLLSIPQKVVLTPIKKSAEWAGIDVSTEDKFWDYFTKQVLGPVVYGLSKAAEDIGLILGKKFAEKITVNTVSEETVKKAIKIGRNFMLRTATDPVILASFGPTTALKAVKVPLSNLTKFGLRAESLSKLEELIKESKTLDEFIKTAPKVLTSPEEKAAVEYLSGTPEHFTLLKNFLSDNKTLNILNMTKKELKEAGYWGINIGERSIPSVKYFKKRAFELMPKPLQKGFIAIGDSMGKIMAKAIPDIPALQKWVEANKSKTLTEILNPDIKKVMKAFRKNKELQEWLSRLPTDKKDAVERGLRLAAARLSSLGFAGETKIRELNQTIALAYGDFIKSIWEDIPLTTWERAGLEEATKIFTFYLEQPQVSKFIASKMLKLDSEELMRIAKDPNIRRQYAEKLTAEIMKEGNIPFPTGKLLQNIQKNAKTLKDLGKDTSKLDELYNKILDSIPVIDNKRVARFISSEDAERIRQTLKGVLEKVKETDNMVKQYAPFMSSYLDYFPHMYNWEMLGKVFKNEENTKTFIQKFSRVVSGNMKKRILVLPVEPFDETLLKTLGEMGVKVDDIGGMTFDKAFNTLRERITRRAAEVMSTHPEKEATKWYSQLKDLEEKGLVMFPSVSQVAKLYGEKVIEQNPFRAISLRVWASREAFTRSALSSIAKNIFSKFPELVPDENYIKKVIKDFYEGTLFPAENLSGRALEETFLKVAEEKGLPYKRSKWLMPGKIIFTPLEGPDGGTGLIDRLYMTLSPFFTNPELKGGFLKALKNFNTIWKGSVTMPYLSFHLRNGVTNIIFLMLEGLNPFDPLAYKATRYAIKGTAEELKATQFLKGALKRTSLEGIKVSLPEGEKSLEDLLQEARELGVLEGFFAGELGIGRTGGSLAEKITSKRPLIQAGGKVAEFIEGSSRLTGYLYWRMKGYTPEVAAMKVNKALFNYRFPGKTIAFLRSSIFPFATFYAKAMPFLIEKILERPGIFLSDMRFRIEMLKKFHLIPGVYKDFRGDFLPLGTEVHKAKPGPGGMKLPERKVVYGINMETWDPFSLIHQLLNVKDSTISLLNPVLRAGAEVLFNKQLWSGRQIERFKGEKRLQYIPFIGDVWMPAHVSYAINTFFRSPRELWRLQKALRPEESFQSKAPTSPTLNFLRLITGLKLSTVDVMGNLEWSIYDLKRNYLERYRFEVKKLKIKITRLKKELSSVSDPKERERIEGSIELYKQQLQDYKRAIKEVNQHISFLKEYLQYWWKGFGKPNE